jgi:cobalt-zinc-cadmium efflux system outer membrane protein
MFKKKGYITLLSLMLLGCGQTPEKPQPTLMDLSHFEARSLSEPDLQRFMRDAGALGANEPLPVKWNFKYLYWAAIYYNPAMSEARAQIEAAKAAEITAGQRPNPIITFGPGRDSTTSPTARLFDIGLSIPIETNGKRDHRKAIAYEQTLSAQSQLISKAWDIRSAVLNSLLDYNIASETVSRLQALEKTQNTITGQYNERTSQGQLPTAIASQAQISYQQSHLQLEQAKTDLGQARVKLAGSIGIPVAMLEAVYIDDSLPSIDENLLLDKDIRRKSLENHPLLIGALADYRAAHQALELEIAKQIPDIDLGPGYEWNSVQGNKISLGITLVLPIMNNNEGPIAETTAKRLQAARHFDTLQATTINNIEQAKALRRSAQRELKAADGIIGLQYKKQTRLEGMIQQNEAGTLPLLYARSEIQTAQVSELLAKAKWIKASASLEDAMRQPLFGPVIESSILTQNHEEVR